MKKQFITYCLLLCFCLGYVSCQTNPSTEGEKLTGTTGDAKATAVGLDDQKNTSDKSKVMKPFARFIDHFPKKDLPFEVKDMKFAKYIADESVNEYIDLQYIESLRAAEAASESADEDDVEISDVVKYVAAARFDISKDFHTLLHYQMAEGAGPRGWLSIANYAKEGLMIDQLQLDVFEAYLSGTVKCTIFKDKIVVEGGPKAGTYTFAANGKLEKQ